MNIRLPLNPLLLTTGAVMFLIVIAGVAILQTDNTAVPVPQGLLKQRWYDPAILMQKSDELKDKEKEFEKKVTEKGEEFKKRAEDIQKSGMELQKKQAVLSADKIKEEREELEKKYNQLTTEAQFTEKKIQEEMQQIRGTYERKLLGDIKEFKDKNKIDVIQPMIPGTFVNKELDVTDELADFVNKRYNEEKAKKKKVENNNNAKK